MDRESAHLLLLRGIEQVVVDHPPSAAGALPPASRLGLLDTAAPRGSTPIPLSPLGRKVERGFEGGVAFSRGRRLQEVHDRER